MKFDISALVNKGVYVVKENAPKILIGGGILAGGACVFFTGKQTMKLPGILEEHKARVEKIHKEHPEAEDPETKKALTGAFAATAGKVAKNYITPVAFGTTSVVCILSGAHMFSARNAALAAAYTTVDTSFRAYRENVIKRHGKEEDDILRFGASEETETVKVKDSETGKTKKVEKTNAVYPEKLSDSGFARYFDKETSCAYEESNDYNWHYLSQQEEIADRLLHSRGYLFLNEVYDVLGIKLTSAGQIVGWVYDKSKDADVHVSFGARNVTVADPTSDTGRTQKILLDFNVQGPIFKRAEELKLLDK